MKNTSNFTTHTISSNTLYTCFNHAIQLDPRELFVESLFVIEARNSFWSDFLPLEKIYSTMSEQNTPVVVEASPADEASPKVDAKNLASPMACLFSFFCSASSTAPLSVPNPASMNGPWNCLIVMIFLCVLYGWPCVLIVKHMRPFQADNIDTIINDRYPKYRYVTTFFARIASLIIMLCADIALFMFVDAAMMNIIFNQFSKTIGKQYLVFLPAVGVWCMSLIQNPKIFVMLTSYSAVGTLINFIALIVYACRNTGTEKARVYRDQWKHPGKYLPWSEGGSTGVGAFCVLAGVLSMSFFIHNCTATILCVNSKPQTNVRITSWAFLLLGVMYWLIAVVGALPFSTALLPDIGNQNRNNLYAPGNFLNALADSHGDIAAINQGVSFPVKFWYFGISTFIYGLQCFCTLPLLYSVTRDACVGWFDMKGRIGSKWSFLVNALINAIVVILSAFAQAYNMSLQTVMAIGGFVASCVWVLGLPVIYDILVTKGEKGWIWRTCFSICCSLLLLLILILQYVLPN